MTALNVPVDRSRNLSGEESALRMVYRKICKAFLALKKAANAK
jgi:hypothetical protein